MKDQAHSMEWYVYSTAKIHITWNGHVQPMGFFKTATAANKAINENCFTGDVNRYKIVTPDGTINAIYDPPKLETAYPTQ